MRMSSSPPPLPPGQRAIDGFPRFGLTQFATRFPKESSRIDLEIQGEVEQELRLIDALAGLPRVEQVSDFHCVTTWSRRSLRWGGVRFAEFYENVIVPQARPRPGATLVALRGQDGARTGLPLQDLLAPDVLLADSLDGAPLTIEHARAARSIAPAHDAYKSVKHLSRNPVPWRGRRISPFGPALHGPSASARGARGTRTTRAGLAAASSIRPLIGRTVARFARATEERAAKDAAGTARARDPRPQAPAPTDRSPADSSRRG